MSSIAVGVLLLSTSLAWAKEPPFPRFEPTPHEIVAQMLEPRTAEQITTVYPH